MAEKGLGKGLDALFGIAALEESDGDFVFLPISRVEARAEQPRKRFDDEALNDLADSIAEHGVIQPLTVRKLASGYYQIIAGERRWRAARQAGLTEVPVRVIEADDKKAMELALIENLQRENLSPVEEAEGYRTLMEEYGLTQEETAQRVGKSRPAVANALRLLALPAGVRDLLEAGKLSGGHARAILGLKNAESQEKLANKAVTEGLSVRQVEALVKSASKPQKVQKVKDPLAVDYAAEVSKRLTSALGRKVRLVEGKNKGRFEIEYYGSDDLEVLIEALARLGNAE